MFPKVSSPLFRLSNWLLKLKSMLTAQGKEGKKKNNNPNSDPASTWKSCCLHGNPATRMEIPPRSSRSCGSPGRASLQSAPDEFLLISGQHHPETQLITHEGLAPLGMKHPQDRKVPPWLRDHEHPGSPEHSMITGSKHHQEQD